MGKDFLKDKISKKTKDQIEKIVEYSGNGKRVIENLKTEVSSHNDNKWPKGSALGDLSRKWWYDQRYGQSRETCSLRSVNIRN